MYAMNVAPSYEQPRWWTGFNRSPAAEELNFLRRNPPLRAGMPSDRFDSRCSEAFSGQEPCPERRTLTNSHAIRRRRSSLAQKRDVTRHFGLGQTPSSLGKLRVSCFPKF